MRFFTEMRVGAKLILGFLVVALISAVIGGLGIRSLSQVNGMADIMYEYETRGVRYTGEANTRLVMIGREFRNIFLASSVAGRADSIARIEELFKEFDESMVKAKETFRTKEGLQIISEIEKSGREYKLAITNILAEINTQPYFTPSPLVAQIIKNVEPAAHRTESVINDAVRVKQGFASNYSDQITELYHSIRSTLIVFTVLAALLGIAIGAFLTRGLLRQLGGEPATVSAVANNISQGKLDTDFDLNTLRVGSVMHSMGVMQNALRSMVMEVRNSSDSIAMGTTQISAGNMDLSQRTEEQAANVTETASAMEEITSTLRSNADSAKEATQLAAVVRSSAVAGQNAAKDVEASMEDMRSSSEQIVSIINVIDSIAFQTNILALNAAVEAARAGSEGRGFAVVASEVRTLAQRSASAAQDIKHLIEDSVNKVSQGNEKARLAGSTIQSMVEQVNQVATLIDEISAATLEQSMGVEQVNQAIGQLEEVTQQNSALVEQSAVAAASLNDQASHLVDVVRVFDLGDAIDVQARERNDRITPAQQLSAQRHLLGGA